MSYTPSPGLRAVMLEDLQEDGQITMTAAWVDTGGLTEAARQGGS